MFFCCCKYVSLDLKTKEDTTASIDLRSQKMLYRSIDVSLKVLSAMPTIPHSNNLIFSSYFGAVNHQGSFRESTNRSSLTVTESATDNWTQRAPRTATFTTTEMAGGWARSWEQTVEVSGIVKTPSHPQRQLGGTGQGLG